MCESASYIISAIRSSKELENNAMLANMNIVDFLEKTASSDPVPGGGSISALGAAAAASLAEMVANLTIGRKEYAAVEEEMKVISNKALNYRDKLVKDIDKDSDAYKQVLKAFKFPIGTEKEKRQRKKAIQEAFKNASLVPLSVAKDAFKIIELAENVIKKGNKNAITDGAVAAMMARTAVLSALYNVKINLSSIKDVDFVNEVAKEVELMESKIEKKEKEILSSIDL
jgi:formiminotetrahydrofolate cyclodeaminase